MLALLRLPLELLWVSFHVLIAVVDSLTGRRRRRFESTALIKAPRDAVWRFITAPRAVFDGPPVIEMVSEPLPGGDDLNVDRVFVGGLETRRFVEREIRLDENEGTLLYEIVPHELALPPAEGTDYYCGAHLEEVPGGSALTLHAEVTFGSFRQRIVCPLAVRQQVARIRLQCEKEAGRQNQLTGLANHWLVLSLFALLSFWYLWGWQEALLIALIIVLHELGHAAAMRMAGISVQGIYLIPFFGGAAVPKTAYRSQGQLGFIALMGPGFSLIPTLALVCLYYATGDTWLLHAAFMFAVINGLNLLPVYPLDGGLILNSLLSSLSRHLAHAARWVGILTGLGAALYFQSFLLGIPFLLFALQLYVSGGRTSELKRLSPLSGMALVLTFAITLGLYLVTIFHSASIKAVLAGQRGIGPLEARLGIPIRCDVPAGSAEMLDRYLSERGRLNGPFLIRILAWADRAGHGDIVNRRLEEPHGFALPMDLRPATEQRVRHWLALAKSGPLAAIEAEIASWQVANSYVDLRGILTGALVVHGRYHDALALLPPSADRWKRLAWLHTTLVDLVSAGAGAEALLLLERTRSDTVEMGRSLHLLDVAKMLQRLPSALGDKKPLINAIADQLHILLKADPSNFLPACLPGIAKACTDDDKRRLARDLRGPNVRASEMEAVAGFGEIVDLPDEFRNDPRRWWHLHAVLAASLAEQGDSARSEVLRNHIIRAFAAPEAQTQGHASHEQDYPRPMAITDLFEIAYTTTRVSLRLSRGDVEGAEALAEAAMQRFKLDTGILALMIDHYLSKGQWSRADAWRKRHVVLEPEAGGDERLDEEMEAQALFEFDYQLNVAAAAAKWSEPGLAGAALQRAQSMACERAKASAYLHNEWSSFLRRAYLLKAFQEGRLPSYALDRP